jgi:acetaldehyde dehydrogenase (acetylating)
MTLGCGSWGGNVTSDNISPLHLMDIKRVAFEVRPVTSAEQAQTPIVAPLQPPTSLAAQASPQIDRAAIAELVDKFLSARPSTPAVQSAPTPPPAEPKPAAPPTPAKPKAAEFVCEDDVRQAIAKGEKIFVTAKTIITPSARDLGNEREVFTKGN